MNHGVIFLSIVASHVQITDKYIMHIYASINFSVKQHDDHVFSFSTNLHRYSLCDVQKYVV